LFIGPFTFEVNLSWQITEIARGRSVYPYERYSV